MIPNLGYAYSQGYEPEHLGVREKKINNGGKRQIRQQCKTRYKSKVVKLADNINYKYFVNMKQIRNTWKVLKCGAGEGWKRSVGPIM